MSEEPPPHRSEKLEREAARYFCKGIQVYSLVVIFFIVVAIIVCASRLSALSVEKIQAKEKAHHLQSESAPAGSSSSQ
jgi:hypothetical protein